MNRIDISTHILTKRMTEDPDMKLQEVIISTHILTKRMTKASGMDGFAGDISTHILTKRMTRDHRAKQDRQAFQLTSSRRG